MIHSRVIPCLLLKGQGLVKTVRFREPKYLGDPRNIVKIFNDKEVDELILLDILATPDNRPIQFGLIEEIAAEAFMPVTYGGGVRTLEDACKMLSLGVEKIAINSQAAQDPQLIREVADCCGSQSVVVSIDVRRTLAGKYEVCTHGGRRGIGEDPVSFAKEMEGMGAGEILLTSVDRDGTMSGYDLDLIRSVASTIAIPLIANGGAGGVHDFGRAVKEGHASAAAAGSVFVFAGKHKAVLISYPKQEELNQVLS